MNIGSKGKNLRDLRGYLKVVQYMNDKKGVVGVLVDDFYLSLRGKKEESRGDAFSKCWFRFVT
jgi:hypothetical protein